MLELLALNNSGNVGKYFPFHGYVQAVILPGIIYALGCSLF